MILIVDDVGTLKTSWNISVGAVIGESYYEYKNRFRTFLGIISLLVLIGYFLFSLLWVFLSYLN